MSGNKETSFFHPSKSYGFGSWLLSANCSFFIHKSLLLSYIIFSFEIRHLSLVTTSYFQFFFMSWTVHTTNLFQQLLPKEENLPFQVESIFPFRKNRPLSEDTKFKSSLCMSLVFDNLLLSIEQCSWLHLYFPFGKFHLKIHKMADFHMKQILTLVRTVFCWIDIFIRWFEDYQLLYQFIRLLLKVLSCSACKCNYLQTWLPML